MDGVHEVGVPDAYALLAFADASVAFDPVLIRSARAAVLDAVGEAALIDAAAVIAGFNGIVRIADAMGIPLEPAKAEQSAEWREPLGIDRYATQKS
jgi:alkylhydroperoxidase family enzyme